jgi:glycosyltransferase involved in cell wall biosynthesis
MTLSVIIIAKNESRCLERCLQSVQFANEIIVLDSGSVDNTVAIAKQYTPFVYETDWKGYGIQKQRALAYATSDWVLNLDADEWVDDALKSAITSAMLSNQDAYRVPIQLCFYGTKMHYSGSPSRHIRLFKREGALYSNDIVHEKVMLPPTFKIDQLHTPIWHDSYRDVSHALDKMNRYSSYSASIRIKANLHPPSVFSACMRFCWMFFRTYVLQRGFLDGEKGLFLSFYQAEGAFYRAIKQRFHDSELVQFEDNVV